MNKHTPRPWEVTHQVYSDYSFDIVSNGKVIATCGATQDINSDIAANARLIAAAPELLKMLKKISNSIGDDAQDRQDLKEIAEEAIAKAEGKLK